VRLTRFTDYAVRVMLYLAAHSDRLCSIGEIAEAYGISQNHLMKVVSDLAGAGFIEALRGRNGGLRLARPAAEINMADLVRQTEGVVDLVDCAQCPIATACGMVSCFDDAVEAFFASLKKVTLADVYAKSRPERFSKLLGAARCGP